MALQGVRVLVVDDNKTNRIILEQNLKVWGARSTSFESGREALAGLSDGIAAGDPYRPGDPRLPDAGDGRDRTGAGYPR